MDASMDQIHIMVEKMSRQIVQQRRKNNETWNGGGKLPCNLLLSPEALRISNALQSFITDSEIALSRFASLNAETIERVEGKELLRSIQEHHVLAMRVVESEITQTDAGKESRIQLERDFLKSVRILFKSFKANPEDVFEVKRTEEGEVFIGALKKFHKHIVERLKTNPDEELHQLLHIPAPSTVTQKLKDVNSIEEEMAALIKTVDLKIQERNEEINTLESQLHQDDAKEMPFVSDEHCQSHIKSSEMRQAAAQKQIDELGALLRNLILENKDSERELQEKNERMEIEIEEFLHEFDEKMEENQAKLEEVHTLLNQDEAEIEQLEKPYAILKQEYSLVIERRQCLEQRQQEQLKELKLKTRAALVIQAYWRGQMTRNALKRKSKVKKTKSRKKEKRRRVMNKRL